MTEEKLNAAKAAKAELTKTQNALKVLTENKDVEIVGYKIHEYRDSFTQEQLTTILALAKTFITENLAADEAAFAAL